MKLADSLRGLAERVEERGNGGNFTTSEVSVREYIVDVLILLQDVSSKTLLALEDLGFVRAGESKTARILIGTIDVRKLGKLAALPQVIKVEALPPGTEGS